MRSSQLSWPRSWTVTKVSIVRLWVFLLAVSSQPLLTSCQSDVTVVYQQPGQCLGQVLRPGLRYGRQSTRSRVECAALCARDAECSAFLYHPHHWLCYLGLQSSFSNCSNMVRGQFGLQHFDMTSACLNGGELETSGTCTCAKGYVGRDCSMAMRDCNDVYFKGGYKKNGAYWVHPRLSKEPLLIYCRMVSRPRTYVMRRLANDVDFNRPWSDYKLGFGNFQSDFWLGLDKLHVITCSDDYELRFRARVSNGSNLFQSYKRARVGDEGASYRLTFDPEVPAGTLGDCLSPVNGAAFSTPGRDNDGVDCAGRHEAGFWFRGDNCTLCNPTGPLPPRGEGDDASNSSSGPAHLFWTTGTHRLTPRKVIAYLSRK